MTGAANAIVLPKYRTITARRLLTILGGAATASAIWWISSQLFEIPLTVSGMGVQQVSEVGFAAVLASSLVSGMAAWALLALLERFTRQGRKIWRITAVATLVLSMAGPATAATTVSAGLSLTLMHCGVAAILMRGLPAASRTKSKVQS